MNGLLQHLGELVALSASSPFWRAQPTGLASVRQLIAGAGPRSGPPPRFRDYADYVAVVGRLERTDCIADYSEIWWDVRPHPRLGTIEIRVCDATTRVEDSVALSAYCQALVKHYCELYDDRVPIPAGNSADRQLQTFAVANSIVEVAAQIADQTDAPGLRRQAAASSARCGRRDHDQGSGSETTQEGSRRAE